jgi:hypothetical protein
MGIMDEHVGVLSNQIRVIGQQVGLGGILVKPLKSFFNKRNACQTTWHSLISKVILLPTTPTY